MTYEHGVGVLIAIPTLGRPTSLEWAMMFKSQNPPINYNANVAMIYGKPVAEARNEACEEAIRQGARYIFFLGDDTIPPTHALRQLIYRMEQYPKLGVVGGIYCTKTDTPDPLVFRGNGRGPYWDWKVGEYFEVSGLGMDCTLIRTEILEKLAKPWFKTVDSTDFLDGRNYAEMWTEDLYFCKQILENTDYKIYADSTVMCKHYDYKTGKSYTLSAFSPPMRRFSPSGEKKILDIGSGELYREFEEGVPVRVDTREECNPDYRCDVRQLPFGNNEFDIVFSSHVLEHFKREEVDSVLKEWVRVLRSGGELRLILPCIEWAAEQIVKGEVDHHVLNVLYGAQSNPYDFHMVGFTTATLKKLVEDLGCIVISVERDAGYNMILKAKKGG